MRIGYAARLCCVMIVLSLGGCAAPPPKPVPTKLTITSSADVNPDSEGRSSPVVVRFYQLRTDAEFSDAQFFKLYDDEKVVLGASLVTRDEFTLKPGEVHVTDLPIAPDARFFGVLAAYRDPTAQWRAVVAAAGKKPNAAVVVRRLSIRLNRTSVTLAINE